MVTYRQGSVVSTLAVTVPLRKKLWVRSIFPTVQLGRFQILRQHQQEIARRKRRRELQALINKGWDRASSPILISDR